MKKIFKSAKVKKRMPEVSDEIIILTSVKTKWFKNHTGSVESIDSDGFVLRDKSSFVVVTKDLYKNVLYKHNNQVYKAW